MKKNNNNMICDIETGVCGDSSEQKTGLIDFSQPKKSVDIYYVTDPICSHCWAQEPVFRRFIGQYGHYFNFHTVMGGLLEKWHDGPIDPANGIYKPADVSGHWREVGKHTRMPIDGSLMIDNPIQSSFPPSRIFKVIQKNHSEKIASEYLRRAREALFVYNQNIAESSVIIDIVNKLGLDGETIAMEANQPGAHQLLQEDFEQTRSLGASGFPSMVMINEENQGLRIVGGRPFGAYVDGLKHVLNLEELQPKQHSSLASLLEREELLFSREIEEMYSLEQSEVLPFIKKELASDYYEIKEFLGESYFITTK